MEASFGVVQTCATITPRSMKNFRYRSKIFLFTWNLQDMDIYEYELSILDGLPKINRLKESLHFTNRIVSVIDLGENLYAFDSKGSVYLLDLEESCAMLDDMDIFDQSPDQESVERKKLIGNFDKCDELLAVEKVADGVVSCSICQGKFYIQLWYLNPLERRSESIIPDMSPCKVCLSYSTVSISNELKIKYFNFLLEEETNILLLGSSSGHVFSFSCSRNSISNMNTVITTPYSIASLSWILDRSQSNCIALLIQFSHGAAMLLHGDRSHMIYLAGPVYTAFYNSSNNVYLTSDGIDCVLTKLLIEDENDFKYECSISPLKGIRSICTLQDENLVFVGTQHNCIYWLNLSLSPVGDPSEFQMPDDRLLESLLSSTVCLEAICEKMEKEDAIIRAVALAKRAHSMSQYFSILAKVYSGSCSTNNKIKVRIETTCDFIEFSSDVWRLELSIVSPRSSKSEIILKRLKKSFNCDNPIVSEMEGVPTIGSEILCSLFACIESDQPWLAFPIGKITLDAGYFLSLESSVPKLNLDPPSSSQSVLSPVEANRQCDTVLSLMVNQSALIDELFPKIFFNSSHRMSKQQWLSLKDQNMSSVNAMIGPNDVHIKLDRSSSSLKISSKDIETCHFVREAIVSRIYCNLDVCLDQKLYIDAESVRLSFEVEKLKSDWSAKSLKQFKDSTRAISKNLPI